MATEAEERYIDHIKIIARAECDRCGKVKEEWDEMMLVHQLMKLDWSVVGDSLVCPKCNNYEDSLKIKK